MEQDQAGTKPQTELGQPRPVRPGEAVANLLEKWDKQAAGHQRSADDLYAQQLYITAEHFCEKAATYRLLTAQLRAALQHDATAGQRSEQSERSGRPNSQAQPPKVG